MEPTSRILIVDDHETLRRGVRSLLVEVDAQWEVCGEARDGQEALDKVRELSPDLVILDVTMPIMNGLEAASKIRRLAPSTKILLFSMHDSQTTKAELHRIGADAFVVKTAPSRDLIATVARLLRSAPGNRPSSLSQPQT